MKVFTYLKSIYMKDILEQMRAKAIDTLTQKIEWRKRKVLESQEKAIAILMGDRDPNYTYEQTCAGIVTLHSIIALMEGHLALLQPPVVEPVKAKRGRPSKKK
jgi:hypothetical protein